MCIFNLDPTEQVFFFFKKKSRQDESFCLFSTCAKTENLYLFSAFYETSVFCLPFFARVSSRAAQIDRFFPFVTIPPKEVLHPIIKKRR